MGRRAGAGARRIAAGSRCSLAALALTGALSGAAAQEPPPGRAFSLTNDQTLYPLRDLGGGVFVVLGDSGQGAEGRPNAGFVETEEGIVVVGGLASPAQARAVIRTIRTRSEKPIRWLVLYAHHPDMMFGAIEMRRAGAGVIAHPDTRVLAAEGGPDAMVANWHSVVGLQELLGFEYADQPDRPVSGWDTLRLGGEDLVVIHPGPAHSAGDLMLWIPGRRVLFSGDILVEDGITMVVDGNSRVLLATLALIDSLAPRVLVPGHGRIPGDPARLVAMTRGYITSVRDSMRAEVRRGTSMRRAVEAFPPPDPARPVSPESRIRRNAVRVYLEMEREAFGLDEEGRP
jgi:glyoxylase-like metal-dependent hydrolase (beta-lactamase superfamily II)